MRCAKIVVMPLVLLFSSLGAAQELSAPAARQGAYVGAGVQATVTALDDDTIGSLGVGVGTHMSLRVGQMVTPRFGLGLLFSGDLGRTGDWSSFGGGLSLEGQVVPLSSLPFAMHAGIGLGALGLSRRDAELQTEDDPSGVFGARYHARLSYDWFPFHRAGSGGVAATVVAEAFVLPGQGTTSGGGMLGLELTYWLGLSDNQLEPLTR